MWDLALRVFEGDQEGKTREMTCLLCLVIRPATPLGKEAAICLAGLNKQQAHTLLPIQTLDELPSSVSHSYSPIRPSRSPLAPTNSPMMARYSERLAMLR